MCWLWVRCLLHHSRAACRYSLTVAGPLVFSGDGAGMLLAHDIDSGKLLYGLGANEGAVRCLGAVGDKLVAAGDDGNGLVFTFR